MKQKVTPTKLDNVFNSGDKNMSFDVHTPNFIKEIVENSQTKMYDVCFRIFNSLIAQVAERATELHDPVLDALMIRLGLYEIPYKERYKIIGKLKEMYDESVKQQGYEIQ